jgi:nitrite reductase (NO-forming)
MISNRNGKLRDVLITLVLFAGLLTSGCGSTAPARASNSDGSPSSQNGVVAYTLKTGMSGGGMAYIGVGGSIDGVKDPDLHAQIGDTLEITLVDGDGMQHDISFPDFNTTSDMLNKQGDQVKVSFKVDKSGTFDYFCTVPGHRQAGMAGKLIVVNASGQAPAAAATVSAPSISRDPTDLPGPLPADSPTHVRVDLTAEEVTGHLADGTTYTYWTYNGKVPGPFLRIRVGDTVEVHLKNPSSSTMAHSVDFHAVVGPGGGGAATQTPPGGETSFTFKALHPGLFVYHCATPSVAEHIANGMFGMILVEPQGGLPPVDREFYIMQNEIYTVQPYGTKGQLDFSPDKLYAETPEYYVFNGATDSLTTQFPLQAKTGQTIRIFFGNAGPNEVSSFHVIGEVFARVYDQGSLTSPPLTDVQTTLVPPGSATTVELELPVPGQFTIVDHAISRVERGLVGYLKVSGPPAPDIFQAGPTPAGTN